MALASVGVSASSTATNQIRNSSGGSFDDVEITGAGSNKIPSWVWVAAAVLAAVYFLRKKKS